MSSTLVAAHKTLMHYTTGHGLKGIVETGSLWATNAKFLNDSQELIHYFEARLPILVAEIASQYVDRAASDARKADDIERLGGRDYIVEDAVHKVVDHFRAKTLGYNDPFVLSLCAPMDKLAQKHGLLSQWRGYGSDGGYAIVFSTEEMEAFLVAEEKSNHYQNFEWGDVFYYGATNAQSVDEDIAKAEKVIRVAVEEIIQGGTPKDQMGVYFAITTLSCLSKHWGFYEEREVRIVAIPQKSDSDIVNTLSEGRSPQTVSFRSRNGLLVPYIVLKGDVTRSPRLPISSVIVGPHKDKELRRASVSKLLLEHGYSIPVNVSEIPYLGD